jgi:hypothetical protein
MAGRVGRGLSAEIGCAHALGAPEHVDVAQAGQLARQQRARLLLRQRRRGRLQALEVVVAEETRHAQQHLHVGVAHHPAELARLVERVERDHDRADARGGEPGHDPVGPVRKPQADAAALADAGGEQAAREPRRALVRLGVVEALVAQQDHRARPEALRPRTSPEASA